MDLEKLQTIISLIKKNYGVNFIVTIITLDGNKIYKLKRRRDERFLWFKRFTDFTEINSLGNEIIFNNLEEVAVYLRFQFMVDGGFIYNSTNIL